MNTTLRLGALLALGVWGCTQNGNVGTDSVIAGVVVSDDNSTVPTGGDIAAAWGVSGNPGHDYVFGTGTLTETGFEFPLMAAPPSDALNTHEGASIGVAFLVAFEEGRALPEGRVAPGTELSSTVGASNRHALLYRANETPIGISWMDALPVGYSCGVGVEDDDDEDVFDSFAVIDCSLVEIRIGNIDEFEFVNWT